MSGSAGSGTPWLAGARLGSRAGLQPRRLPIVAGRRREAGPRAPGLEACPGEPSAGAGGRARDTSPGPEGSRGLRGGGLLARAPVQDRGSWGACVGGFVWREPGIEGARLGTRDPRARTRGIWCRGVRSWGLFSRGTRRSRNERVGCELGSRIGELTSGIAGSGAADWRNTGSRTHAWWPGVHSFGGRVVEARWGGGRFGVGPASVGAERTSH